MPHKRQDREGESPQAYAVRHALLALAVILGLSALAWPPRPMAVERDPSISTRFDSRLDAVKPRVVLMGNSMLGKGVDESLFNRLAGVPSLRIYYDGAASAWWYVVLKNVVVAHDPRPELVVMLFRDNFLTQPDFRVTGKYQHNIDLFAGADEPVLDRLAYYQHMDRVTYALTRWWPLYQKRQEIKDAVSGWVKRLSAGLVADLPPVQPGDGLAEPVDDALDEVFADENMNSKLLTIQQLMAEQAGSRGKASFGKALPRSFLPHIVETAEKSGTRLAFVRVKRRRDVDPEAEPPWVKDYVSELRAWLEERGIPLLDYTHDDRIELGHYGNGDHLNSEGRVLFTRMLAQDMKPYLPK